MVIGSPWSFKESGDIYSVYNSLTNEKHAALSLQSAVFLRNLFNEQDYWYNYTRYAFKNITLKDTGLTLSQQANWRVQIGDDNNTFVQFYIKKGPNWFQRKAYALIFKLYWSKL